MPIAACATLKHGQFHTLGRVQMNSEQAERIAALRGGTRTGARAAAWGG
jgi:hypothetical protein